jgi:hypothetical protein
MGEDETPPLSKRYCCTTQYAEVRDISDLNSVKRLCNEEDPDVPR